MEEAQRIMLSNNLLEVGKSSASNDVSNMERKQYLDQIHELVQAVQTFWMPILLWVISRRSKRLSLTVRLPICRSRLTSLQENCKLMAPLDFFRGFFDMIVAGRRDYALMTEALLVKPV